MLGVQGPGVGGGHDRLVLDIVNDAEGNDVDTGGGSERIDVDVRDCCAVMFLERRKMQLD